MDLYIKECQHMNSQHSDCDIDTILSDNSQPDLAIKIAELNLDLKKQTDSEQIEMRFEKAIKLS